ncbi:YadA family autotransporter adhesin [Burkholderia cepacia]|uniref:YadA family autotransporter adhesin n=1 Tax=Burkholderia cepacia TaxID=292 RepID=UPI0018C8A984|nr:YadA-like family protein [Burkholderia cepacia]
MAIGDPNVAIGIGAFAGGNNNTANGQGAVALGNGNVATGTGSIALGNLATAAGAGSIALGSGATASNANDVALGTGSVTATPNPTPTGTVGGTTYNYAGTSPSSVVSVGVPGAERQITNVAAGRVSSTSTDAVNGSQLYATDQAVNNLSTAVSSLGNNLGSSVAAALGGGSTYNAIAGVITPPSYTVYNANGSSATVNNVGAVLSTIESQGIKYFHTNSTGADSSAVGSNAVAIGPNAVASANNSVAIGAGAQTSAAVAVSSATVSGRALSGFAGLSPVGVVSVGSSGSERQVINVAAGQISATSTDAVNGSQLFSAVSSLSGSIASTNSTVSSLQSSVINITSQITNLGSKGIAADMNGTGTDTPTVTAGTSSVAIGSNSNDGGRSNVVSVGNSTQQRQITNVAAGTEGTDAVNVNQLNALSTTLSLTSSNQQSQINNLGTQLQSVQSRLSDTARRAYSGVAAATALTMIPEVDPGKTLAVGIGAGSYQGYAASALGVSVRFGSDVKAKLGVGFSASGTAVGGGVSYQW